MPSESGTSVRLQIGHVLFMDLVGYSTQLLDEQRQYQEQLTEIVRGTEQVRSAKKAGKVIRLPVGDGVGIVLFDSAAAPVRCALGILNCQKWFSNRSRSKLLKLRLRARHGDFDVYTSRSWPSSLWLPPLVSASGCIPGRSHQLRSLRRKALRCCRSRISVRKK